MCKHIFRMALFLLCKTVEHMAVMHKFFTCKESMHFTVTYDWVMKQWHIELPLLSAFIFFTVITKLYLFYRDGF